MIDSDLEKLDDIIAGSYEIFDRRLTEKAFSLWATILKEYDINEIEAAFMEFLKNDNHRKIPSPKNILDILNPFVPKKIDNHYDL